MRIKFHVLFLMASLAMVGCYKYDDLKLKTDLENLKTRVEKIETWCKTTNGQIVALQGIVSALEDADLITAVTPAMDGAKEIGYTITFTKGSPITILHGKDSQESAGNDGVTPIIGVKLDSDGHHYWTVKIGDAPATWLTDDNGDKIRTTGDTGGSPVMSVDTFEGRLYWKIDGEWLLNGANKVPATGDKGEAGAQGDAIFALNGVDYTTDPDNVIFTLADGTTKITMPKANTVSIGFDSYDTFYCSDLANELAIVLPATLKQSDYTAIIATITNDNGTDIDIQSRSSSVNTWGVAVTKPTFTDGTLVAGSAKVKLTLPQNRTNYKALLKVTLIDSKGKEHSVSRVVWFRVDKDANVIDNSTGTLASKIPSVSGIKQLSIIGPVSDADFAHIRKLASLEVLDLSRTTITALPEMALDFSATPDAPLKTIILPDGVVSIESFAFDECVNLQDINMPKSLRRLSAQMFGGCASLNEINLPEGLTEVAYNAFYKSGVRRVTIPSTVVTIDSGAFASCPNLVSINVPNTVKSIGGSAFFECSSLTSISIPKSVTQLGTALFKDCTSLESAEILANVNVLSANIFMGCYKLNSIKLSTTITTLESNAFANTGLIEYTIPSHIKTIKAGAFSSNSRLTTVVLPSQATFAFNVFNGCQNLMSVTIPEGITELGGQMFRSCTSLASIELPASLTSICDRAFQDCSALKSVVCKAVTAPTLSADNAPGGRNDDLHFYNIAPSCVLKRPLGSDYSAWSSKFKGGVVDL